MPKNSFGDASHFRTEHILVTSKHISQVMQRKNKMFSKGFSYDFQLTMGEVVTVCQGSNIASRYFEIAKHSIQSNSN